MAYIHVYQGNPTAGGTNGTQVSEGTGTAPVSVSLNASNNEESAPIKLALRCDAGYQTNGNITITPVGTTASKWALAPDNAGSAGTFGAYGASLTVSSVVGAANVIFWAKAKATSDETPQNDVSVDFQVQATIEAV